TCPPGSSAPPPSPPAPPLPRPGWPPRSWRDPPTAPRWWPAATAGTATSRSWLLLAESGDPLADLGVVGHQPVVGLVVGEGASTVAQVEVAEDGQVPVRVVEVGELGQGRLVAGTRLRELSA